MESEVKDGEEESLQTAFKKLRVDADGSTAAIRASETPTQRIQSRSNSESAKPKMVCTKDNWHGCSRKSSRGVVRNQRRRRSKSPILLPPKFTYCSSRMSSPACCLKHKSQCETSKTTATLGTSLQKDLLQPSHCSPVFGTTTYEPYCLDVKGATAAKENSLIASDDEAVTIKPPVSGSPKAYSEKPPNSNMPSDFQTLSKLNEDQGCSCPQDECQCKSWQGVEVYSFTGLRHVISECEKNMTAEETSQMTSQRRTQSGSGTSGSPRSCSEQARAYVDDITIEDLSGYMEYYLYIPKKMSHMAEMMYT